MVQPKIIRRLLSVLFLSACLLVVCMPVSAGNLRQETVKVGYAYNYGMFQQDKNGVKTGYGCEYLDEIAKYTGWTYEFVQVEWNEGMEMLKTGRIDLLGPMQKTDEREVFYDYPERELGFEYGALYVDENKPNVYYDDVASFDQMKVAVMENSYFNEELKQFCQKEGIEMETVDVDAAEIQKKLQYNEVDAVFAGSLLDIPHSKVVAKVAVLPYYFATTKGNTRILNGLNMALDKIYREDAYFANHLEDKYYGNKSINIPAYTKEEVEFVAASSPLKIVCDPEWVPIEYYDQADKSFRGANIDIVEELGRSSGLNFEFVKADTFEQAKAMIDTEDADLIMGYSQQYPENANIRYTNMIWKIPILLVGRQNVDFSDHLLVGRKNLEAELSEEIMETYPNFKYRNYDTSTEIMDDLQQKKIDAAFLSTYVYDEIVRHEPLQNYITVPTTVSYQQRIGVSDHVDPIVIAILDKAIKRLSEEQTSTILFSNTVNRAYQVPISQIIKNNAYLIIGILLVFIGMVAYNANRNRKKLEDLVYVDRLTGVSTFTKFQMDAVKILKTAAPLQYAFVTMDIDDFKYINDAFGYDFGTKIISAETKYFADYLDKEEVIGRMNADHLVMLCKSGTAERLCRVIEEDSGFRERVEDILGGKYNLTFSIGFYKIEDVKEEFSLLYDRANSARKTIKGDKNVSIAEYTQDMDEHNQWKREITLSMEDALAKREFEVVLQPKYLLQSRRLVGAEALIRWNHPTKGRLSPGLFIPIFEQNGFIKEIDMYVFEQICIWKEQWHKQGMEAANIPVSVNLSRLHMYNSLLAEQLLSLVHQYGISPRQIEIELTESTVFYNIQELAEIMTKLRKEGFLISIDDFGSGYSSLSMLKDIPVDIIKIDKGFLEESSDIHNGRVVIESILRMAQHLKLTTVAEGTENIEQVNMLQDMGCDIAQGFYFSKPLCVAEFERLCETDAGK